MAEKNKADRADKALGIDTEQQRTLIKLRFQQAIEAVDNGSFHSVILTIRDEKTGKNKLMMYGHREFVNRSAIEVLQRAGLIKLLSE